MANQTADSSRRDDHEDGIHDREAIVLAWTGPAVDDADLRGSLSDLAHLATGHISLSGMLTQVAEFATRAITGADGAGLTLFQDDQPDTIVATGEFVRQVDAIQYSLREGPCITASAERRTVRSGSLGGDRAFPRFGPRAARLGVHSVVSLPLEPRDGSEALGSLNVYAHHKDAFTDRAVELGELFAVPAAISVQNALALSRAQRLAAQLESSLATRAVIDQALGILRSRSGCSPEEAFDKLRVMSQSQNRKLFVVAEQVLDEAVRRARARHIDR